MRFSVSFVGGSKSAEGGPYPLAHLDRGVQINRAVNFPKIHRIKQRDQVIQEMGSKIIPNSIISFISAKLYANPWRFDRDGKTSEMTS